MSSRQFAARLATVVALAAVVNVPSAAAQTDASAPVRIAVVDLDAVLARSTAGLALQERLKKLQTDTIAAGEPLAKQAEEIKRRIADGRATLSQDKLADLQEEYEDKLLAMKRLRDDKQREGEKIQADGLSDIEQKMKPVIDKIRADGNYDLILNNVPGVVILAGERLNITKQVIDGLNAVK